MKYSVMTKKNVDDQNKWTFDYFTQEALKKKPRSGIVFRKIPSTRGFVTKCVKYWAGHADDPTPIWKERCWDTYVPDNPNIPDPGTGGCPHCCEEAYPDIDEGGGGGGSGSYTPPSNDEIIDNDPSFVGTKAECVYKNLEFLSSGFRGAIQKFDNEFPVRDIRLTVKPLESYDYLAETTPPMNYKMEISINKDRLTELPNLLLAHLFIHETVHSQMFSKLLTIMKNGGKRR